MRYHLVKKLIAAVIIVICSAPQLSAQANSEWTLQQAVLYALEHNLTIQQNELNKRLAKLTLSQSQLSQLPSINLSTGYGRSFGRSVDPTTNQFVENTSYDFLSLNGNANVLLFGWFQRRNQIAQNKLNLQAADADLDQMMNDISLNVATGYLRALLAKEQVKINQQQVSLSEAQLDQTRKFVESGRLPELNAAQLEAQLASDSSNLIAAITEYNAAILDIKALLNLDFQTQFDVVAPDIDITNDIDAALIEPDVIYNAAAKSLGIIKSNDLKLQAARKGAAASKSALYPQLSLNAQAGTNYSTTFKDFNITGYNTQQVQGSYALDSIGNNIYPLYQLTPTYTTSTTPLGKQLDNNFRQTLSLNLNIPIFNGWQSQTAVQQTKINVLSQQLNKQQAELKLKQDVYKAHNDVRNAIQKYYAAKRSAEAAKRAYDFARQRNELGLTNTVEYLVTQNNWAQAEGNLASTKYDLIFKLKVIDYYLGKELKL